MFFLWLFVFSLYIQDLLAKFLCHQNRFGYQRRLLRHCWRWVWPQSMVLRLASTAVQHQSPQLRSKQPFFALMSFWSFCSVTDCHLCFTLKTFWGRVLCRLFCQMHCSVLVAMSDGDISQWCVTGWLGCHGWSGWIKLCFLLCQLRHMEPAMARHVSPQSGPCFSRSREGGQQNLFLAWSNSPVSLWNTHMESCCFCLRMWYKWLIGG